MIEENSTVMYEIEEAVRVHVTEVRRPDRDCLGEVAGDADAEVRLESEGRHDRVLFGQGGKIDGCRLREDGSPTGTGAVRTEGKGRADEAGPVGAEDLVGQAVAVQVGERQDAAVAAVVEAHLRPDGALFRRKQRVEPEVEVAADAVGDRSAEGA